MGFLAKTHLCILHFIQISLSYYEILTKYTKNDIIEKSLVNSFDVTCKIGEKIFSNSLHVYFCHKNRRELIMGNELRSKIKKTVISFSILLSAAMVIYSSSYCLITASIHARDYPAFIAFFVAGVLAIFIGCAMYFCND